MWKLADQSFQSRLLLGTALYPSPQEIKNSILEAKTEIVTVSLRRQASGKKGGHAFWEILRSLPVKILPNTAGCFSAKEAIATAHLARELFNTPWIKLEVIGDEHRLQPDPFGLLEATKVLIKEGFMVFPYTTEDLVLANRLVDAGCKILMPWGAPIGSGQGLENPSALRALRNRLSKTTLILDAGIGSPSHATKIMEMGFDGVLLNSAVALAKDPPKMAKAFAFAVQAGRLAYEAGLMPKRETASPSTPMIDVPFWHQKMI